MSVNTMRLKTFFLLTAVVASNAVAQDSSRQADLDRYQASLDSLVPALLNELGTPGAAVALFRDGKAVLAKGYGWANREKKQPVTRETLFNIGSISKTHAAWGLLRLVEEGRIFLEDPVANYGIVLPSPPSPGVIRIRHLLSHTSSGMPGSTYRYDGDRFSLLDSVIARATGGSYRVLRDKICCHREGV